MELNWNFKIGINNCFVYLASAICESVLDLATQVQRLHSVQQFMYFVWHQGTLSGIPLFVEQHHICTSDISIGAPETNTTMNYYGDNRISPFYVPLATKYFSGVEKNLTVIHYFLSFDNKVLFVLA